MDQEKLNQILNYVLIGIGAVLAILLVVATVAGGKPKNQPATSNQGGESTENVVAQGPDEATVSGEDESISGEAGNTAGEDESISSEDNNANGTNEGAGDSTQEANKPAGENPSKEPGKGGTGVTVVEGLSETGNGYEGSEGTGDYNYGEALQMSLMFYELQRSGDLSKTPLRTNWRGSSGLSDGSAEGIDLSGGLNDAGDNMKFNLPMAYTSMVLAWSVYESRSDYEKCGQLTYIEDTIRWVNDYLIKCHPEDEVYYYQVGAGSTDHAWWGPCEVMTMDRPCYKVTADNPGSTVTAEAAASLAACATIFKDTDPDYAANCLSHAKSLFAFAQKTKSDAGYTEANGFYQSWSGWNDELAMAGCWLYLATDDESYLKSAKSYMDLIEYNHKWTMCWDDVSSGALVLLCEITGEKDYQELAEKNLDWWSGSGSEKITYSPKGLAWLDSWGSLRYATTAAYLALVYSDLDCCSAEKKSEYEAFALSQVNYALGSTGRSFVVGFGENPPLNVHHRTAHGSYTNNINDPGDNRHTLYGALAGGPDASDNYSDDRNNFNTNEVACDYNAGFTGALAMLYHTYGGQTRKDFGAVEPVTEDEVFVEAGVNVNGNDFVEFKAYVYNESAWPAREISDLELRYFVDLTEVYDAGGSVDDMEITTNYMQAGAANGLHAYDEEKHIYYISIDFTGASIYPGGQESYKKEIQVRIRNTKSGENNQPGVFDSSNDPSFEDISNTNGSVVKTDAITLYEGGKLVWGHEPG